jgi:hypothetical protein
MATWAAVRALPQSVESGKGAAAGPGASVSPVGGSAFEGQSPIGGAVPVLDAGAADERRGGVQIIGDA